MATLFWGYGFTVPTEAKDTAAADAQYQMVLPNFSALAKQVQSGVVNIRTVKTSKRVVRSSGTFSAILSATVTHSTTGPLR